MTEAVFSLLSLPDREYTGHVQDLLERMDFGNEAADDADASELASYFVEQTMFHEFLNPRKKLLIAKARKGVGKSALPQWTAHKIEASDEDALVNPQLLT